MAKKATGRLEADGLGVLVTATEAAALLGLPAAGIHAVLRHRGIQPVRILGVLIMRRGRRTFYRLADLEALALKIRPVSHSETAQGEAHGPEGGS